LRFDFNVWSSPVGSPPIFGAWERSHFSVFFADLAFSLKGEQNKLTYEQSTRECHPVATNKHKEEITKNK
jgi:hypothetical protein